MIKKIILLISALIALFTSSYAQDVPVTKDNAIQAIKEGDKSVSGNKQDVLVNYLQVAANNVTSTGSNINLKINWFALNNMDSVHKYMNTNFVRTRWQRNLQLLAVAGMDKTSKFNSIGGGISYNVWNKRDTTLHYYTSAYQPYYIEESVIISLAVKHYSDQMLPALEAQLTAIVKSEYDKNAGARTPISDLKKTIQGQIKDFPSDTVIIDGRIRFLQKQLNDYMAHYAAADKVDALLKTQIHFLAGDVLNDLLTAPVNVYVKSYGKKPLSFGSMIDARSAGEIGDYIDGQVKSDAVFKPLSPKGLSDLNFKVLTNYEALVHFVAQQPLLTLNYGYTYGKGTALSMHTGGLQYVQGLTKLASKKILELTASVTDTLSSTDPTGKVRNFGRNIISAKGGFNKVLAIDKKVSVMELNLGIEEDLATSGYVTKTDASRFYFDAYYRVRLPTTPWLKLDIKYDPKAANVLGLLDFTYNLDKP